MQAARGTPLSAPAGRPGPGDADGDETTTGGHRVDDVRRARRPRRLRALLAAVALALYALDQVSKWLAVDRLEGRADVSLVGDLLQLHLTRNAGAAFSTGTEYTVILSCVAIGAVVVVLFLSRRVGDLVWACALGSLLAGVSGNLTDRILREPAPLRGHVVDFLMLPNWPIFNVADVCINLAAALILIQAFRGVRLDGSRPGVLATVDTATGTTTETETTP